MNAVTTLPARGSIAELHAQFDQERRAFDAAPVGFDVKSRETLQAKCALFANRLIRAPAGRVQEIILKIEAAEWLGVNPKHTLELIRTDLDRMAASA